MKIVACYKLVPEERDIEVKADRTLDFSKAAWKVGEYDLPAVELAMQIGEASGAEVELLTFGGDAVVNSKLKKGVYARGPQAGYAVQCGEGVEFDSLATAKVLAAAIDKIGDVDLVICGEGSGDVYAQQVGPMLGALLGRPSVNAVCGARLEGASVVARRDLGDRIETVSAPLPAVLSCTAKACVPRVPGMKDILAASKKSQTVWDLDEVAEGIASTLARESELAPEAKDRACQIFEGVEAIQDFASAVRKAM